MEQILKKKELADHLERREILLCSGELKKNPEELNKIIHDDFVEFRSSGRVWDKSSVIKSFENLSRRECSILEFNAVTLAEYLPLLLIKQ